MSSFANILISTRIGLTRAYRRRQARQAEIHELSQLPDYILNDIGVTRDQRRLAAKRRVNK